MNWHSMKVGFFKHDNGGRKVTDESTHLDMLTLADDHWLVAFVHQHSERVMRFFDEWTGGVDDGVAGALPSLTVVVGCTMGGDGDLLRAGAVEIIEVTALRSERGEMSTVAPGRSFWKPSTTTCSPSFRPSTTSSASATRSPPPPAATSASRTPTASTTPG